MIIFCVSEPIPNGIHIVPALNESKRTKNNNIEGIAGFVVLPKFKQQYTKKKSCTGSVRIGVFLEKQRFFRSSSEECKLNGKFSKAISRKIEASRHRRFRYIFTRPRAIGTLWTLGHVNKVLL